MLSTDDEVRVQLVKPYSSHEPVNSSPYFSYD